MSARGPSSALPRRSSPRRNNRGPSSAPARRNVTYTYYWLPKRGWPGSAGMNLNPHRAYGFKNSEGTRFSVTTNRIRNTVKRYQEGLNNLRPTVVRTRLMTLGIPMQYIRNIANNVLNARRAAQIHSQTNHNARMARRATQRAEIRRLSALPRWNANTARMQENYRNAKNTHNFERQIWEIIHYATMNHPNTRRYVQPRQSNINSLRSNLLPLREFLRA
jgi:hypothetical protein